MIRLVIGDGHPLSRRSLRALLESQPDLRVVAEATDGHETVLAAVEHQPDVVLVEATLPGLGALTVAATIRRDVPDAELLVLSHYMDPHLAVDVMAAGAQGFLVTSDEPEELFACVRALAQHTPFVGTTARGWTRPHGPSPAPGAPNGVRTLTTRERTVVRLIAEGLRSREIARHLEISEKTVESHRAAIFRKLELDTLADVVRYAIRNSMIKA